MSEDSTTHFASKFTQKKQEFLTLEIAQSIFEYKDGHLINKVDRLARKAGTKMCDLHTGYYWARYKKRAYPVHRIIWLLHYKVWPRRHIDHINGIKTDNRIENLREVTHRQNMRNAKRHVKGKIAGYSWSNSKKRFRASIFVNGSSVHLGYYRTEEEAETAYYFGLIEYDPISEPVIERMSDD